MDPQSASLAFATVVQLVCNFRQERGVQKSAELTDFLTYLAHHKFEEIKNQIQNSTALQIELQNLLGEDVEVINAKLDIIGESITSLASRIEGFAGIATALGANSDTISSDASEILRLFEESGDQKIGLFRSFSPPECILLPSGRKISGIERRFLPDDLSTLEQFGLIQLVDYNKSGDPLYAITRNGAKFATSIQMEDSKAVEGQLCDGVIEESGIA